MSRKIYFCGSIRGGTQDRELYLRMIKQLQAYGEVLTEHVFVNVKSPEEDGKIRSDQDIHDVDISWIEGSNVVIAEVTQPSLGVGYEIGRAVALNKNILCLFRQNAGKYLSAMISGAHNNSNFTVKRYNGEEEVPAIFKEFFDKL